MSRKSRITSIFTSMDASSLSAILSKGPMLLPSIYKLLLNFRRRRICIQCDLKEAFYSIELNKESSNKICFLFRDPRNQNEAIQMMRMLVLSMGSIDSTFILNMCMKKTSERCEPTAPEVSRILAEEVYTDDVLKGSEDSEKAITLIKDIDRILKEHGFKCHKFTPPWSSEY